MRIDAVELLFCYWLGIGIFAGIGWLFFPIVLWWTIGPIALGGMVVLLFLSPMLTEKAIKENAKEAAGFMYRLDTHHQCDDLDDYD